MNTSPRNLRSFQTSTVRTPGYSHFQRFANVKHFRERLPSKQVWVVASTFERRQIWRRNRYRRFQNVLSKARTNVQGDRTKADLCWILYSMHPLTTTPTITAHSNAKQRKVLFAIRSAQRTLAESWGCRDPTFRSLISAAWAVRPGDTLSRFQQRNRCVWPKNDGGGEVYGNRELRHPIRESPRGAPKRQVSVSQRPREGMEPTTGLFQRHWSRKEAEQEHNVS